MTAPASEPTEEAPAERRRRFGLDAASRADRADLVDGAVRADLERAAPSGPAWMRW